MADVLVDTDVLIDQLRGTSPWPLDAGLVIGCSVVTRCELFAGAGDHDEPVRDLLSKLVEFPVDPLIAERAGRLRNQLGISTPDALIAATALEHDLSLATRNIRHFEVVPGLRLEL